MKIRILQVFFGADGLPYKDQARTVHYPITGNGFQNANNTTQIRFYFSQLSGENTTWVAVSKLPNGKVGSKVLETYIDDELNEPYALLELDSYYTQYKGDIFISLQGYQGGVQVTYDEQTEIYEISGTPTIAATGSIKFTNNYAPSFVGSGQEQNITIQQLLGYLSSKADIGNTIYIVVDIEDEDLSGYEDGQVIYDLFSDLYYEVNSQVQGGHVLANENGLLGNKGALIRFFGLTNTITLQQIYNLIGANRYGALNISGKEYLVIMSANNSIKAYDLLEKKLYSYLDAPNDTFADVLNETPITFVEHRNEGSKVYGTNASAQDTTIPYSSLVVNNGIVQRESTGQIRVPTAPTQSYHATSKSYVDSNYGKKVQLTIDNETFVLTVKLLNNFDTIISQASVDLPLESIVVSAQYYDTYTYEGTTYTKVLVIVLATTDNPIIVPVGDLVSGLVSETTFNNAVAQLQTNINKCVQQTNTASVVYGTNASGSQTTIKYGTQTLANALVQRDGRGQITVYGTPSVNTDLTNKQYVDTFGRTLEFSIDNSTYVMTFKLKDNNGNVISTQTIDLPLETVVVDGYYDSENENLVLELKNGNEITIPISDLISGLVTETSLATTLANYYTKSQIDQMVAGFVFADVDDYLSDSSTNPVENRVITDALETKANVDGNYPTMSVGEATDLSTTRVIDNPEESCPPIVMGVTGGNAEIRNGLQKFQYMEGASEVFNQLFNVSANSQTTKETNGVTFTVNNNGSVTIVGQATARATSQNFNYGNFQHPTFIAGHKYYGNSGDEHIALHDSEWKLSISGEQIITVNTSTTAGYNTEVFLDILNSTYPFPSSALNVTFYPQIFDLTLMYGAGNEPTTVDEFKAKYPCDYYAYNAGTILSAKTNALISRGRQQWDEEWENGSLDANGANQTNASYIRSKNYIPVIGGEKYYFRCPTTTYFVLHFYDINKNHISAYAIDNNNLTIPSNASYIRFYMGNNAYGTTYHNDITISIYFEDGEGYSDYYPYSQDSVALPNIELRAIGDIKDIAYASGGGKRRIGKVDLGSLGWFATNTNDNGTTKRMTSEAIKNLIKKPTSSGNIANIVCARYESKTANATYSKQRGISIDTGGVILVYDEAYNTDEQVNAFKQAMSGVYLLYELATETELTENTGWVENVIVENYGTLEFVTDPQQIPQVKQPYFIEYTISLKEFLDGTYQRASGNPQNIALDSELQELKDGLANGNVVPLLANNLDTKVVQNDVDAFNFRTSGGSLEIGETCKVKSIVGGSLGFNQIVRDGNFPSLAYWGYNTGVQASVSNNVLTFTVSGRYQSVNQGIANVLVANHKYLLTADIKTTTATTEVVLQATPISTQLRKTLFTKSQTTWQTLCSIITWDDPQNTGLTIQIQDNRSSGWDAVQARNVMCIDLTQMFGSTIADYIYSLEQATSGAGVAWFKRYFPNTYYAYNTGTLVNVQTSGKKYVGFNQCSEFTSGNNATQYFGALWGRIKWMPNTIYCISFKGAVGNKVYRNERIFETPSGFPAGIICDGTRQYLVVKTFSTLDTSQYNNSYGGWLLFKNNANNTVVPSFEDVCINFHYDGERDGEYEPYESNEYALSPVELRGIAKKDAQGNLYFDGDSYTPDGKVVRKYGIVDLGTLSWNYSQLDGAYQFSCGLQTPSRWSAIPNFVVSSRFTPVSYSTLYQGSGDKEVATQSTSLRIKDSSYTDAQTFKTAVSGIYLVYELLESDYVEETTDTYQETQQVDNWGTEQYLPPEEDTRPCEIPVGHSTDYLLDIRSKVEIMPDSPTDDGVYVVQTSSGTNEYIPLGTWLTNNDYKQSKDLPTKDALGGTLRQLLAVSQNIDLLNTAWIDISEAECSLGGDSHTFIVTIPNAKATAYGVNNAISTLYDNKGEASYTQYTTHGNMTFGHESSSQRFYFANANYSDATAFKNAMKGVLLAYEKA